MKKNWLFLCVPKATFLLFLPCIASAAAYACEGYVGNVSTQRGSQLLMESFTGSSWIRLCDLSTQQNGVTPEQCKAVFAQLLAAQLAGKRVRLWFDDSLTCSTHVPWSYATGWYHGPDILE